MEKITKREMYEAISAAMETGNCKFDAQTVQDFCAKQIELLDKRAAKIKGRKAQAVDALIEVVKDALTETPQTIAEIVNAIGDEEVTPSKIVYRLTQLVKSGEAVKQEVKEGSKGRKVVAYSLSV